MPSKGHTSSSSKKGKKEDRKRHGSSKGDSSKGKKDPSRGKGSGDGKDNNGESKASQEPSPPNHGGEEASNPDPQGEYFELWECVSLSYSHNR